MRWDQKVLTGIRTSHWKQSTWTPVLRLVRVVTAHRPDWTELNIDGSLDLPALYVPGWYIEAIDAATAELVYEGFQNFRNLEYLKVDLDDCYIH